MCFVADHGVVQSKKYAGSVDGGPQISFPAKAGADPNHVHSDESNGYLPVEDRALKLAAQFFGKELLSLLGEKTRVQQKAGVSGDIRAEI